jgi:hypothetical protein
MSSKLHTQAFEVGKLKPGMKIEFPKVYAIVRAINRAENEGPTLDADVLLVELVGDCGPFKGRKAKIAASSKAKITVVLRNPFRKLWDKVLALVHWHVA